MSGRLSLFEGFGLELEYMVVNRESLDVAPVVDQLLARAAGSAVGISDVEHGDISWSNELVLHVVEFKTTAPAPTLEPLVAAFDREVQVANRHAAGLGVELLGTAMHPWMNPARETYLWPHEASPIYQAYDRIFGCSGHGWSNLQSAHLNLPFASDEEFGRLHAAIRLVLPLLPALAASSPLQEGRITGYLDTRIEHYRTNSRKIPSVAGHIVPEPLATREAYQREIFERIWADLAPEDPEGLLRDEFANARGAIARFERGSIEIRVVDVQETPTADVAIAAATVAVLRDLVAQAHASTVDQLQVDTRELAALLLACARDGEKARLGNVAGWSRTLGLPSGLDTAHDAWSYLIERSLASGALDPTHGRALEHILARGPLARRILKALGAEPTRKRIEGIYRSLADCLATGSLFG